MFKVKFVLVVLMAAIALCSTACVKKTITDQRVIDQMQAFLDAPPDPANPDLLTPEERAVIESFTIYKSTIKVQLVEETDKAFWEPIGRKIAKEFAAVNREAKLLEVAYVVELFMKATIEGTTKNFKVGNIRIENASDRIYPEFYSPTLKK